MNQKLKHILNTFENTICGACFFFLTVLLTVQVVSRFAFGHSFTWTEELATFVFVWMSFLGVTGATLKRQHLRISFVLEMLPFKARRVVLVADNIIFFAFNCYIIPPIMTMIGNLGGSASPLLKIPKIFVYICLPLCFALTNIRLVQDTIALLHEDEENLGLAETMLDVAKDELYFLENKKGMTHEEAIDYLKRIEESSKDKAEEKKRRTKR